LIPVIAELVFAEQAIIGADIAAQIGIICARAVAHNSFDSNGSACFIASVVCED